MFQSGVGGQNGVVRFHYGSGDLRCWVDGKLQFGFLAIVHRQALHEERGKTGPSATSEGMEDEKSLQSSTLIGKLAEAVQNEIDNFLSDGVMSASVVVSGVLLSGDELFGMKELAVSSGAHFVYNSWLQVHKDGSWDVLSSSSLAKEGVEGIVSSSDGLVRRHLSVRLNAVLQTVELPAGVSDLDSSLSNVDRDTFTHFAASG